MKARLIACAALTFALAGCDGYGLYCEGPLADACSKARDLATVVTVQLGDEAVASGNAIIGQGGALGNKGRLEASFRARVTSNGSPQFDNVMVRTDATVGSSTFGADTRPTTSFAGDFALRVSRGDRVGDTRVAALDLVGGFSLTPHIDGGSIQTNGSALGVSLGARLGILQETKTLPAVSLTGMFRTIPKFSVTSQSIPTDSGGSVTLSLNNGDILTTGWRLAASKQLGRFGIAGGLGRETYDGTVEFAVAASSTSGGSQTVDLTARRNTAFIGGSLGMGRATLAAELGSVFGGKIPSMNNTFEESPDAARAYLTLGVRLPIGKQPQ